MNHLMRQRGWKSCNYCGNTFNGKVDEHVCVGCEKIMEENRKRLGNPEGSHVYMLSRADHGNLVGIYSTRHKAEVAAQIFLQERRMDSTPEDIAIMTRIEAWPLDPE
jgi:predicted nucleic acid-binding Zn ribbon protein